MLKRFLKNPVSLLAIVAIASVYLIVHFNGMNGPEPARTFLLYLAVFLAGLSFVRLTILRWFRDLPVAVVLLVLAFGTNLFSIVALDYQLQAILLFSLYSLAVYLTASWHENQKQVYAVLLAICLGFIILLHSTGLFSLLIPVLWNVHDKESWKMKVKLLKNHLQHTDIFLMLVILIGISPFLLWQISPGEVPFLSIKLPGLFYGFSSWLWSDLFSFDHGWLIYTPVMIFAFIGFQYFSDKHRPVFYSVYILCILDIILETSWSKLGATPVFGQIAFIPIYGLLVIPLAFFFQAITEGRKIKAILLSPIVVLFLLLNIFQTWQFNQGIILSSGMNADNYCRVFGRTGVSDLEKQEMAGVDSDPAIVLNDKSKYSRTILAFYNFEEPNSPVKYRLTKVPSNKGTMAFTMDESSQFSPTYAIQYGDFRKNPRVGMSITVSVFADDVQAFSELNLVITSTHKADNYLYKRLNLGDLKLKPRIWHTVSLYYLIPADPPADDKLGSCVWYTGKSKVYVDDIKFEAFELKK